MHRRLVGIETSEFILAGMQNDSAELLREDYKRRLKEFRKTGDAGRGKPGGHLVAATLRHGIGTASEPGLYGDSIANQPQTSPPVARAIKKPANADGVHI